MPEDTNDNQQPENCGASDSHCSKALLNARVVFGLRNQGHLPTIMEMLANGCSWSQIAREIGWCRGKARADYERLVGNTETRELRSVLAESVELIRELNLQIGNRLDVPRRNRMSEAYMRGTKLLESRTHYDFDSP